MPKPEDHHTYAGWIEAFQIFANYDPSANIAGEHDIIYGGPDPATVSEEHKARLTELGWYEGYFNCFERYT